MESPQFDLQLIFFLAAAITGGFIAHWLRQPPILGYLMMGVIFGPTALGLVQQSDLIEALARVGVALLLFTIGVHLSFREILAVRKVAILGGAVQILLSIALGYGLGQIFGFDRLTSVFLGAVIALSSTTVVLKVLGDRAQLSTVHGRILAGMLIAQDLAVIPLLVILPSLKGAGGDLASELIFSAAKALIALGLAILLGARVIPWILDRIAATESRELFVLSIVSMCLGTAFGASALGLPLEIGAFVGGLIVSESDQSHEILSRVEPLRDIFAAIFFVLIGTMFKLSFLIEHWQFMLSLVVAILVGKLLISTAIVRAFGYSGQVSIYVGLGLAQVGEFSFVIARTGVESEAVAEAFPAITVAAALLTMMFTPGLMRLGAPIYASVGRIPLLKRIMSEPPGQQDAEPSPVLSGHVVICGCDEIGQLLINILENRGLSWLGVDYDPVLVRQLRQVGRQVIYGDSSSEQVLELLRISQARMLAVTVPDPFAAELTVKRALRINPRLDVVVRAATAESAIALRGLGAGEAVDPKYEGGLEMIRHALHRFGMSSTEASYVVNRLRLHRGQD